MFLKKYFFISFFLVLFSCFFYIKSTWKTTHRSGKSLSIVNKSNSHHKLTTATSTQSDLITKNNSLNKSQNKTDLLNLFLQQKVVFNESMQDLKKFKKISASKNSQIKNLEENTNFDKSKYFGPVLLLKSFAKVSFTKGKKKVNINKYKGSFTCKTKKNSKAYFYLGKNASFILHENSVIEFQRIAAKVQKIILYKGSLTGWFNNKGGILFTPLMRVYKMKSASLYLAHKDTSLIFMFDGKALLKNKKNKESLVFDEYLTLKTNKAKFKKFKFTN